jgi:SAM-dependent methyltransferase
VSHDEHRARQERFYREREHDHLRVRSDDPYADNIVRHLVDGAGIGSDHRVLEVGAGFGRFTFPLLEACGSVVALDLSDRVLGELTRTRDERGIPEARCQVHCGDANAFPLSESFDFVVGFFVLHHLPDYAATLRHLTGAVTPGGGMAFVEPNRRNPAFLAQVAICRDMTWKEEKGMFQLSRAGVETAYREAGLAGLKTTSFGAFPPQLFNSFQAVRTLEPRLERLGFLAGILPFWLLTASKTRTTG